MPQIPEIVRETIFDTSEATLKWPRLERFAYRGYYGMSPDGSKLSASIVYKQSYEFDPTKFVLLDLNRHLIVAEVADAPHRVIDGFAWSPDSKMVAVLEHSNENRFRLKNILANISGHPVSYVSYFLVIYDDVGSRLSSSNLATNLVDGSAQFTWYAAKTLADGIDSGRNCDLAAPPRNAGVEGVHGVYIFIFPPKVDATYDGCQVVWDENGNRYLVTRFERGEPKYSVYLPDADASIRAECFYDKGTLSKGGSNCLGYDMAKRGMVGETSREAIPPERDLRLKSDSYGTP